MQTQRTEIIKAKETTEKDNRGVELGERDRKSEKFTVLYPAPALPLTHPQPYSGMEIMESSWTPQPCCCCSEWPALSLCQPANCCRWGRRTVCRASRSVAAPRMDRGAWLNYSGSTLCPKLTKHGDIRGSVIAFWVHTNMRAWDNR